MAFCVTDDHARQEQVLDTIQRREIGDSAWNIRRLLTETCVEAQDPRARFVGLDAYLAAGGTVMRDLFEDDDGGWLQDPDILMRLVADKLAAERERILAQGWKWVEAALELPYNLRYGLRRLQPIEEALSEEEQAHYTALAEEHDALIEGLSEDDIPDEVRARLDAIEAEMAELDSRPPKFARRGHGARRGAAQRRPGWPAAGRVRVPAPRGRALPPTVRPATKLENADEDSGPTPSPAAASSPTMIPKDEEAERGKPLPDRLVQDLTACRTVALRNALAQDFDMAFLAVLHAMCLELFYQYAPHSCLQIKANSHFPASAPGLAGHRCREGHRQAP